MGPHRPQITTRSRKPILRHACYNHTCNTHVQYEQQVSLQFSTKYTTLLITLAECTQRSQDCDPTLHQTCGSKVGLSTDKFNKWLREALSINKPIHKGTILLTGTTLAWSSVFDLEEESTFGVSGFI